MSGFDHLAARLLERAKALAARRALARRGEHADNLARWRRADLLWPRFGKD